MVAGTFKIELSGCMQVWDALYLAMLTDVVSRVLTAAAKVIL
jgi:hypothetical protein